MDVPSDQVSDLVPKSSQSNSPLMDQRCAKESHRAEVFIARVETCIQARTCGPGEKLCAGGPVKILRRRKQAASAPHCNQTLHAPKPSRGSSKYDLRNYRPGRTG